MVSQYVEYYIISFKMVFNTPLEHTPKLLQTGYKGIPFIVGGG